MASSLQAFSRSGSVLLHSTSRRQLSTVFQRPSSLLRFTATMSEMEIELNEEERQVKTDFEAACRKLNMDQDSMDAAWTSYDKIKDNFTLEVRDLLHLAGREREESFNTSFPDLLVLFVYFGILVVNTGTAKCVYVCMGEMTITASFVVLFQVIRELGL